VALVFSGSDDGFNANDTTLVTGQGRGQHPNHRKLSTFTITFTYTGAVQQWVVPAGLAAFTVDAYGAAGGDYSIREGGLGGYISVSNISASSFAGQTLFIYVGGTNGFNGGGTMDQRDPVKGCCSIGGGATDIRYAINDYTTRYLNTYT